MIEKENKNKCFATHRSENYTTERDKGGKEGEKRGGRGSGIVGWGRQKNNTNTFITL